MYTLKYEEQNTEQFPTEIGIIREEEWMQTRFPDRVPQKRRSSKYRGLLKQQKSYHEPNRARKNANRTFRAGFHNFLARSCKKAGVRMDDLCCRRRCRR